MDEKSGKKTSKMGHSRIEIFCLLQQRKKRNSYLRMKCFHLIFIGFVRPLNLSLSLEVTEKKTIALNEME